MFLPIFYLCPDFMDTLLCVQTLWTPCAMSMLLSENTLHKLHTMLTTYYMNYIAPDLLLPATTHYWFVCSGEESLVSVYTQY